MTQHTASGTQMRRWARAVSVAQGPDYSQHHIYQDVFCVTMGVALLPTGWMYFIQDLRRMFGLYTAPSSDGLQLSTLPPTPFMFLKNNKL